MAYEKPIPVPNAETKPYWDGCKRHELLVQTCDSCGNAQLYPRIFCTRCHSESLKWKPSSGRGTVYSYTIIRRAPSKAFKADVPYVLALVELDEGVRLMTNVIGCSPDKVKINLPVRVVFEDVTENCTIPKFVPAEA